MPPNSQPPFDPAVLDRYLAGEADVSEVYVIEQWFLEAPDERAQALAVRAFVAEPYGPVPAYNREAQCARIVAYALNVRDQNQRPVRLDRPLVRGVLRKVVAIGVKPLFVVPTLALCVLLGLVATVRRSDAPPQRFQTVAGQRATVRWRDGSVVVLAPATSMVVTPTGIDVVGEAYFTVSPHASRAMVVRMRNVVVRVLGTRFLVRQYAREQKSQVMVEDGKVSLRARRNAGERGSSTTLSARMAAQVSDSGMLIMSGVAPREYTGWVRGTLVFNGVLLGDVVTELTRIYGVDIRIADSVLAMKKMRLDVSIADESLPQVLELIGQATDAHYTRDGRAFVLVQGRVPLRGPNAAPRRSPLPQLEKHYGK